MEDVQRLFRELVKVLKADGLDRLAAPFQISELYQSILPYRRHRNDLGFDTNQDYEMAVLRLLGGQGDLVTVEPDEVREILREESASVNPDTGVFRGYAAARVNLNAQAVQSALDMPETYAPPGMHRRLADVEESDLKEVAPEPAPPAPEPIAETPATTAGVRPPVFEVENQPPSATAVDERPACRRCAEPLPEQPDIKFCPFCGVRVGAVECSQCGMSVEPNWRFCVSCGHPSHDG